MSPDDLHLSPSQLADLSALADGTLDSTRREEVKDWISSSPEVRAMYMRERAAVAILHRARALDRAPDRLRSRVERQRTAGPGQRRQRRLALVLAAPVAAAVTVLALALPAGTPGALSISQAAALAGRGPAQAAPGPNFSDPRAKLSQDVQNLYFPNWAHYLGWRAVGQRRDRLGGRLAVTVYYARGGKRVAYTILAAPALRQPYAAMRLLHGVRLRTLQLSGRTVVTWRRAGHTCVISATGVSAGALQHLAAWQEPSIR